VIDQDLQTMKGMLDCAFDAIKRSPSVRDGKFRVFPQYDGNHLPVDGGLPRADSCPAIYCRSIEPGTRQLDTTPEMEEIELKVTIGVIIQNTVNAAPFPSARCLAGQLALKDALISRNSLMYGIDESGRVTGIEWSLGAITPLLESKGGPIAYWDGEFNLVLLKERAIPERSL
jgi:hypothetical protein